MFSITSLFNIRAKGLDLQPLPKIEERKFQMGSLTFTIIGSILKPVIGLVTPEIKTLIEQVIKDLYIKAKATSSPYDDLAIEVLAEILSIDLGN